MDRKCDRTIENLNDQMSNNDKNKDNMDEKDTMLYDEN
jgi:hypothetical protein